MYSEAVISGPAQTFRILFPLDENKLEPNQNRNIGSRFDTRLNSGCGFQDQMARSSPIRGRRHRRPSALLPGCDMAEPS
jgi:hypothetical protein